MTCLHTTVISTVSVCVAVTSLSVPLAIKGSAWNRQDKRLTGRSPIRAGHVKNLLITIAVKSLILNHIVMIEIIHKSYTIIVRDYQ